MTWNRKFSAIEVRGVLFIRLKNFNNFTYIFNHGRKQLDEKGIPLLSFSLSVLLLTLSMRLVSVV